MDIPAKNELVDYDGLDERKVVEHFLGCTADEAYEMFRSHGLRYCEDFMWMAQHGLEYYLNPAWRYVESGDSEGDWEFASTLLVSLAFQMKEYKPEPGVARLVRMISESIRANLAKFCSDGDDIGNHILDRVDEICESLARHGH